MTVSFSSSSRGDNGRATEPQIPKKWKDRDSVSPDPSTSNPRVPVVYYLSRNGHLDHPHFMEVPLSSPRGLFLTDVINRLNLLRGKGVASLYSWSSKRSYKNSFVWQDLAESDFIYPSHGHEYVLKGSELLLDPSTNLKALEAPPPPPRSHASGGDSDFTRRRNQSWAAIDLQGYKVYKAESIAGGGGESAREPAATQTDEGPREPCGSHSREEIEIEISPPPSDSSPETLESLMKGDGRLVLCAGGGGNEEDLNRTAENHFPSGRLKASSVLMQLLSCGSISFRDCGPGYARDQGLSLVGRLSRRGGACTEIPSFAGVKLEEKEYFSGSVIETKKEPFPAAAAAAALKRSSSCNADRTSQLQLAEKEKEVEGVRAKCIPRKHKGLAARKEGNAGDKPCSSISNSSSDHHGSKRIEISGTSK